MPQDFNPSPAEIKQAYRLVTVDLYNSLLKMKPNQNLRWNKLGKFTKKVVQVKSGLDGNTHTYYRLNFSPFKSFKEALNHDLK